MQNIPTSPLVQLLLEVNNSSITRAATGAHTMLAPWAFHCGGNRSRYPQVSVLDHRVRFRHAFVDFGWHVVVKLAAAALDEHFGYGSHP